MKTLVLSYLRGDPKAARVVPATGYTAHLTLFAAGAMAFLAVFALALSLAAGRLADRWAGDLARSATLRISAPADQMATQIDRALKLLGQTPGVATARALSVEEQAALLSPWFGAGVDLSGLPVPRLIEIRETAEGYDAAGLRLRLAAEVPGGVLDDHGRWRRPLVEAANSLRRLGFFSMALIFGALAAMVTLAANAALAANAQIIGVLRLIGATDAYIARAFVRRFTIRGFGGAAVGTALGVVGVVLLPEASAEGGLLTGLGFVGIGWFLPAIIPLIAATVAFGATSFAAGQTLKELT